MGTPVVHQKWPVALLLVCCLLRMGEALDKAVTTEQKVEDYRHRQRIVGGTAETDEIVVQWQALFLKDGDVNCGGSLVSYNKVVTAAHCLIYPGDTTMQVKVGAFEKGGGESFSILSVRDFPDYHRGKVGDPVNDLKIVEISNTDKRLGQKAVTINSNRDLPVDGETMYVSGYGRLSSGGKVANHLRTAAVPIVPFMRCRPRYFDLQRDGNICAGNSKMDSCQGDSGSALWGFTPQNKSGPALASPITIYGVVSYGQGCANAFAPGVYARLSKFNDWIQNEIELPPTPQNQQTSQSSVGSLKSTDSWLLIALIVTGIVVILLLCGTIFYLWFSRRHENTNGKTSSASSSEATVVTFPGALGG